MTALAVEAASKALQMADVHPDDVDLVLLCTSTPEDLFGSAPQVCVQQYSQLTCVCVISEFFPDMLRYYTRVLYMSSLSNHCIEVLHMFQYH